MEISVTIQAADLAAAIDKLASAIAGANLTSQIDAIDVTEPESAKRRTRKSSKTASNQDGQTLANEAPTDQPGLPYAPQTEAVIPIIPPAAPQVAPPIQAQQPGYWPQVNAVPPVYSDPVQAPPQYQQPMAPPVYAAPVQAPPLQAAAPAYTMEQLGLAGMQLVDAGRREEVAQLLTQFGVSKLTDLPKERYAEYAMALRQRGAKI
jgi:hypothetical protein